LTTKRYDTNVCVRTFFRLRHTPTYLRGGGRHPETLVFSIWRRFTLYHYTALHMPKHGTKKKSQVSHAHISHSRASSHLQHLGLPIRHPSAHENNRTPMTVVAFSATSLCEPPHLTCPTMRQINQCKSWHCPVYRLIQSRVRCAVPVSVISSPPRQQPHFTLRTSTRERLADWPATRKHDTPVACPVYALVQCGSL